MARAPDLGIRIGRLESGPLDAITDVPGVRVGHRTLIEGEGPLQIGRGPVRTGVTVIVPREDPWTNACFAGAHVLNGNGEMTGLAAVMDLGFIASPIGLTNTHSVGAVHEGLLRAEVAARPGRDDYWGLPVVAETWDGTLNDINGFHVRPEHALEALADATDGPVEEGNVGGGTGMIVFGFKGGIGTASRLAPQHSATVGVLVQANFGARERLTVAGVPVGRLVGTDQVPLPWGDAPATAPGTTELAATEAGSIIGIVATDAPLLPHQCRQLAERAGLGMARTGGIGGYSSGDLFLAFSTGNVGFVAGDFDTPPGLRQTVELVSDAHVAPIYEAAVDATEEAIINALLAARTMTGRDGNRAHALDPERLVAVLKGYAGPLG
jgi:D-aminopeptidase